VIRIDQLWLCTAPLDMRAGAERLLSRVVQATGAAHAHHGYLFANARATRIKLLGTVDATTRSKSRPLARRAAETGPQVESSRPEAYSEERVDVS
jgi:transposase